MRLWNSFGRNRKWKWVFAYWLVGALACARGGELGRVWKSVSTLCAEFGDDMVCARSHPTITIKCSKTADYDERLLFYAVCPLIAVLVESCADFKTSGKFPSDTRFKRKMGFSVGRSRHFGCTLLYHKYDLNPEKYLWQFSGHSKGSASIWRYIHPCPFVSWLSHETPDGPI